MKLKPGPAVWDRKIPHVPLKSLMGHYASLVLLLLTFKALTQIKYNLDLRVLICVF